MRDLPKRNRNLSRTPFIHLFGVKATLTSQTHCVLQSSLNVCPCKYVELPTTQSSENVQIRFKKCTTIIKTCKYMYRPFLVQKINMEKYADSECRSFCTPVDKTQSVHVNQYFCCTLSITPYHADFRSI